MPSQTASQVRTTVAANLDFAIRAADLANHQVASAVGTTEHQVWRWRKGRVRPSDETLAALGAALGRELAWFFTVREGEEAA